MLTFIFCLGFKSALQNGTKSTARGSGSCSRCKCEQDSEVGPIPFSVLLSNYADDIQIEIDQALYIFFRQE